MIKVKIEIFTAATLVLSCEAGFSHVWAENCRDIPEGRFRFECRLKAHPGLAELRQKCYNEALAMGLPLGEGHQNQTGVGAGPIRDYVKSCMQRATFAARKNR
jgi:hypothetical protein